MRRQSADAATNLPGMTNREDLPATVAVPVELLEQAAHYLEANHDALDSDVARDLRAHIPKPKPRLVAVTHEQWIDEDITFDEQPDLLTLLDEVIRECVTDSIVKYPMTLRLRLQAALGVTG